MPTVTSHNKEEFDRKEMERKGHISPKIDIKHDEKKNWMQASSEHGLVGGVAKNNELRITHSEIGEEHRGKGIGKALYKSLIDHAHSKGMKVYSDSTVEMPAVHVYKSLEKEGYGVKRLEGGGELKPDEDLPHGGLYGKNASNPVFEVTPRK